MFPITTQLSKAQQQVLSMLASGHTITEAAAAADVHRNTIANWRRSSESFRNHWNTMQYEQAMHWRDQLQSLAPLAMEALQTLLTDPKTPPSVRLRAALAVLDKVATPPPAQPDLHKSAQPTPQRALHVVESAPAKPAPAQEAPNSAQPCTAPAAAGVSAQSNRPESAEALEQLLAQLTSPPPGCRPR